MRNFFVRAPPPRAAAFDLQQAHAASPASHTRGRAARPTRCGLRNARFSFHTGVGAVRYAGLGHAAARQHGRCWRTFPHVAAAAFCAPAGAHVSRPYAPVPSRSLPTAQALMPILLRTCAVPTQPAAPLPAPSLAAATPPRRVLCAVWCFRMLAVRAAGAAAACAVEGCEFFHSSARVLKGHPGAHLSVQPFACSKCSLQLQQIQ
jgi:hypothetical protein